MKARVLKYAIPLLLYSGAWRSFAYTGWVVWIPVLIAFVIIPILELFIKPSERNLTADEEEMAKHDKAYDWLLYLNTQPFIFSFRVLQILHLPLATA
jgi:alkane 1-monooxygenase